MLVKQRNGSFSNYEIFLRKLRVLLYEVYLNKRCEATADKEQA